MAGVFEIDLSEFLKAAREAPKTARRGAERALDDVKDDWVRQARDVAPLDTSNLRRQIHGEVEDYAVTMTAPAKNGSFNYAYYIHEKNAGGRKLRTPGTVKKFLDQPAEQSEKKWRGWIEDEVDDEIRKAGWS